MNRFGRVADVALKGGVVALLVFVVGVQLGIRHGRWLQARESRPAFLDTTCPEAGAPWPVTFRVTATAYNSDPAQTDSTPLITASGTRARVGTLAVSRDLLKLLPYGTTVYVVEDTMHPRWERRVDFWMPDRQAARRFGRRELLLRVRP